MLLVPLPVVGTVGLVLEPPAIATAITTSMISMILIREIFKTTPSRYDENADNVTPDWRNLDVGIRMVIYV